MAVNKDAIGILFGVAGGAYPSGESYRRINEELEGIINGINSNNPKFIQLHVDDKAFDEELKKINGKVKNVAIGANIKIASGEAADGLADLGKASENAGKQASKSTAAFDRANAILQKFRKAALAAADASNKYIKKNLKIRLDENLRAYTDNERLLPFADTLNELRSELAEFTSDDVLGKMYKKEASEIQTQMIDVSKILKTQKGFLHTTTEEEAKHAAQTAELTAKNRASIEATEQLTDAYREFYEAAKKVAEIKNVLYKDKQFVPADDSEEARKNAGWLTSLAGDVAAKQKNPNLSKNGLQSAGGSYKSLIKEILNTLNPDYVKPSNRPFEATTPMLTASEAATQALKDAELAVLNASRLKSDYDWIELEGESFRQLDPATGKAIENTKDLTNHQIELAAAIDNANDKIAQFRKTMAAFEELDMDKVVQTSSFQKLKEGMERLTSNREDLIARSQKAAEVDDILFGRRSSNGRISSDSLVAYFSREINGAKKGRQNNPAQYTQALEDIGRQAKDLARVYGDDVADIFFHAVQKRTHVKLPYWKKELQAATQPKTEEQRIKATEQQIESVETKIAEVTDLASKKSVDVSNAVNKVKTDLQQTEQKLQEIAKTEENTTNKTVENEQKKAKAKQETMRQTEAITESNKQEQKAVQETAKVVKDSEDEKAKKAFEAWKLRNQWLEAEALHEKEKANQAKAAAAEEAAQKKAAAEEVKEAERAVREDEKAAREQAKLEELRIVQQIEDGKKQAASERRAREKQEIEEKRAQERAAAEEVKEAERAVREEEKAASKQRIKDEQAARKQQIEDEKEAIRVADNYYNILLKIEKLRMRDSRIEATGKNWKEMSYRFKDEKGNPIYPNTDQEFLDAKVRYDALSQAQQKYLADLDYATQKELKLNADIEQATGSAVTKWNKLRDKAMQFYRDMQGVATRSEEAKTQLERMYQIASQNDYRNYDLLNTTLEDTKGFIERNGLAVADWFQRAAKTFGSRIRSLLAGLTLGGFSQYLRQIYNNVVEIDSAMAQLRIVTGATDKQMEAFFTNSAKLAKELGTSIKDVLSSIETFSRLGYNLADASTLSQYATILSKVAAVSSEEATKGLTSIIKGYGFSPDDSEHIADVLVKVGQKYAVSASELMTAYEKAGAALNATNTSFEKSAGLIAAANATLQDASVVGTALKTVSARIRKSKTDLDELGESADDLSQSWSVYAEEIKALTGFDIMVEGSTTKFKDLYDIFADIAAVWDEVGAKSETAQARVAEILGGTRQFAVISSILSNWDDAVGAYNDALQSSGTALEAIDIYVDTIQGRLGQLKAAFEEFSKDFLDSELVKDIISAATGFLSIADGIAKVVGNIGGLKTILTIVSAIVALTKAEPIVMFFKGLGPFFANLLTNAKETLIMMANVAIAGKQHMQMIANMNHSSEQMAAVNSASANLTMLKFMAIVAVIAVVIKALSKLDKAWQESYQTHVENAKKLDEEADQYKEEIKSLEDLQRQLQEAVGNKQKLASIYNELNQKIAVSSSLIDGEKEAYLAANQQLQDQIDLKKKLLQLNRKQAVSEQRSAFNENEALRYGDFTTLLYSWGLDNIHGSPLFMWDWAEKDATGYEMRASMRGKNDNFTWKGRKIDYEYFYNQMPEEDRTKWLKNQGFTAESWSEYWKEQVNTALSIFADVIGSADGYLGGDFITNAIKTLVMHGYDLGEIDGAVASLENVDGEVESLIEQYYTSLAGKDEKSSEYYDRIVAKLDEIKAKYPELVKEIDLVLGGISKSVGADNAEVLKYRTVSEILEEMSDSYDALISAMSDMDDYGALTAKTFKTMTENNLVQYLTETENGYILNTDALDRYTEAMIENVTVGATLEEMTAEQQDIILTNLENFRRTLAMLAVSSNSVKSASEARKDALNDEKDALNDQLDAYKKLIDLRKDLLRQYEDEVNYKKELQKKEREVARLQTLYTVSQLDTSAAGRAKTRQLAKELQEAQEDLDDFTLEHAIDVVTQELDGQYDEYKKFIDGKISSIEEAIDALGDSNSSSASRATTAIKTALQLVEAKIAAVQAAPVVNVEVVVPESTEHTGTSDSVMPSSWSSYEDAKAAGFGNIATKEEFGRNSELVKKYGSYQHYLTAMYKKYVGKVAGTHIDTGKTKYHSGGIVGDTARLKTTETFAKLLKGEFVATPAMMKSFINKTLPNIANSQSSNEFNAPLVEINCENVTQESLPKLKDIVDNAVKEIKNQLDGGMSRAGYRKPARKITV